MLSVRIFTTEAQRHRGTKAYVSPKFQVPSLTPRFRAAAVSSQRSAPSDEQIRLHLFGGGEDSAVGRDDLRGAEGDETAGSARYVGTDDIKFIQRGERCVHRV